MMHAGFVHFLCTPLQDRQRQQHETDLKQLIAVTWPTAVCLRMRKPMPDWEPRDSAAAIDSEHRSRKHADVQVSVPGLLTASIAATATNRQAANNRGRQTGGWKSGTPSNGGVHQTRNHHCLAGHDATHGTGMSPSSHSATAALPKRHPNPTHAGAGGLRHGTRRATVRDRGGGPSASASLIGGSVSVTPPCGTEHVLSGDFTSKFP